MKTLIIEVNGGVIQEVYSDSPDLRVIKVDWDVGESPGDEVASGRLHVAGIRDMPEETIRTVLSLVT